jgi:hypothetical protein
LNYYAAVYAAANEWSVVEPSSELGKVVQNAISLGKKPLTKKVRIDPQSKDWNWSYYTYVYHDTPPNKQ